MLGPPVLFQCLFYHTFLRFLRYCMSRIALLQGAGVIPVVVFDGTLVPAKAELAAARRK